MKLRQFALLTLLAAFPASAEIFTISFSANSFTPAGAPQNPVSGSFIVESASATSPITAIDAVNLDIAGHTYALSEVGFSNGVFDEIGGLINGVGAIASGTDDFALTWTNVNDNLISVEFATAQTHSIWFDDTSLTFSVTPGEASVPEPSSVALLTIAAALLPFGRRKLKGS